MNCTEGYYLNAGVCASSCPTSTYPNDYNECENCITGCLTCSDSYTCSSCSGSYFLVDGYNNCTLPPCPNGFYQSLSTCYPCSAECLVCSSGTLCTSCVLGYSLTNNECVSLCGNGVR